jgi:peptide/nickel transport system substrate-binding protein
VCTALTYYIFRQNVFGQVLNEKSGKREITHRSADREVQLSGVELSIMIESEPFSRTTRRRLLAAGGVALGALAGCTDVSDGSGVVDSSTVFGHGFSYLPEQTQLNPWAGNYPYNLYTLLFEPATVSTPRGGHRLSDLLERVTIDGTTVTVEYSDEYTWWNGEPVTARDRWVGHRINSYVTGETPNATLVDEYTLRYELARPLSRQLVLSEVVVDAINTAAGLFEPWLERLEDATTRSARKDVIKRLHRWGLSLDEANEKGFGCGPYEFSEVSPNRLILRRYEEHPKADDISIERIWLPVTQGLRFGEFLDQGDIDGGRGLLDNRKVDTPQYIEQLSRYPTVGGTKLVLNWRNAHLARRQVRRALLCVLPIDTLVSSVEWGEPPTIQTGMTRPPEQRWLDGTERNQLQKYPVEADTERAATLMRKAGYDRRDGNWHDANGTEVTFRLRTPLWSAWASSAQIIEQSLNSFGFNVSALQTSDASFRAVSQRKDYDLLLWWTTGRPYVAYDVTDTNPATLGYDLTDQSSGLKDQSDDARGKPVRPSFPIPGGERTIDLLEQWRRIERPGPERETSEAVSLFARWWNYDLPDLLLATQHSGVWGNTRDFTWPSDDNPVYRVSGPANRPEYHLLRTGTVGSNAQN